MSVRKFPRPLFGPEDGGGGAAASAPAPAAPPAPGTSPGAAPPAGSPPAAWYDAAEGLKPEHREFLAGKKFGSLSDTLDSAIQSDRLARDRNVLPKPDPAKLADWEGWKELGWNPDREKYQLQKPRTPEHFQYDEGFAKAVGDLAHEARVPVSAAQRLLDGVTKFAVDRIGELDANGARANQELDVSLKKEWGQDYDRNKELASRAGRFLGIGMDDGAELEKVIGAPRLMQLFHKIGGMLGEDKLVSSSGGGMGGMSASQVDAELNRQAGDPAFMEAFQNPRHARHQDVRAQRDQLLARKAKISEAA